VNNPIWTSEAFHINADTCVDVKADADTVVLGELGEAWMHNVHFTPAFARRVGNALIEGADRAESQS
jgi:hypothetical protein